VHNSYVPGPKLLPVTTELNITYARNACLSIVNLNDDLSGRVRWLCYWRADHAFISCSV